MGRVALIGIRPSYFQRGSQRVSKQPLCSQYATSNPYSSFNSEPKSRIHGAVTTNWSVPDGSLQCVPDYFALERTSRFVAGTGASIVSARISDCLRRRSIATKFENLKAKAKCTNGDFVQFRIRLFAGRNEYKNGVIVEVQQRSGGSCWASRWELRLYRRNHLSHIHIVSSPSYIISINILHPC